VNNRTPATDTLGPVTLIKAALLFLGAFALYFATRSPGLDQHDSVQFAMGVLDFNLWKHQPHPPGYPLFIFLGWIGGKVFGAGPDLSLHFVSAIGGALFIAVWFLIIRLQFNERFAWWVASCLAITPAVWMTATKVLTDSLAAGLLSAEILATLYFLKRECRAALLSAALLGAAAAGARPQLIVVVLVILITALWRGRATIKLSILTLIVLVAGCLVWLLPMSYTQWRLKPEMSFWSVYPHLAYQQWHWRLDKPGVYIGAGDWSARYLGTRLAFHLLGWFGLGFGFIQSLWVLVIGSVIAIAGFASYFSRIRELGDGEFWKLHAPWALVNFAMIFISLSPEQRYYVIIFPLLWVALLRGFLQMRSPWNWAAVALPALVLYIVVPLAIDNHCNEPPSLRLVRYLARLYPPDRRKDVVLLFNNVGRHVEWYAPGFVLFREVPPARDLPQGVAGATAIYTDNVKAPLPPGWYRIPLAVFKRSAIIFWEHHSVTLYLVGQNDR
jgi:4-amino-4-deoxy-L-arabinose transferase-like glycosyltransferase